MENVTIKFVLFMHLKGMTAILNGPVYCIYSEGLDFKLYYK